MQSVAALLGYSAFGSMCDGGVYDGTGGVALCKHSQMKLLTLAESDGAWQGVKEGVGAGGAHDTT